LKLHNLALLLTIGLSSSRATCQVTPDMATGLSPYAVYNPSDLDNVNPTNGNIFLKIPLLSYPQKGGKLRLNYYIFYNDKQWQANLYAYMPPSLGGGISGINGQWTPAGITQSQSMPTLSAFGVYVARDQFVAYSLNLSATFSQTYGLAGYSDAYTETAQFLTNTATTPDGATHYIGDGVVETVNCGPIVSGCPFAPTQDNGYIINQYPATDASGYDQFGHDPDGITYGTSSRFQGASLSNLAVTDPNGNQITASASGWTDTYNRLIPGTASNPGFEAFPNASNNFSPLSMSDLIPGEPTSGVPSQCGSASAARAWMVPVSGSYENGTATYYLCYTYLNFQTAFDLSTVLPAQTYSYGVFEGSSSTGMGQALLLTSVVLPDGNSYTFTYDPQYLSLTSIGLPTGGSISYTWQNVLFYPYPYVNVGSPGNWGGMVTPVSRALLTRTVSPGDGQPAITTTYHWFITASSTGGGQITDGGVAFPAYSVVTDSNGNDTEYTLGGKDDGGTFWPSYVITAVGSYAGCSPHDTYCTGGGTRLKSVSYALTPTTSGGASSTSPAFIPQVFTVPPSKIVQTATHLPTTTGDILSAVVNTLVPSYGSCTVYTYPVWGASSVPTMPSSTSSPCWSTGQFASTSMYDFGSPGSGNFGALLKTESTPYVWQSTSTYLQANLLDLLNKDVITNGNGSWIAETDYGYDASPSPSGARGNRTSVTPYVTSTSKVTSTAQYNSNGIVTLTADPNSNETSYSNFLCNGALPQTVAKAYGSSTTTPETTTYSYDCNTGKILTVQDPNLETTTYSYADPLSRVNGASYPDGGGASVNYSDVTSPDTFPLTMTVTTITGETSAGPEVSTTTYDGLARKTLSQVQTSSSGPSIYTATNYDNMGHIYTVSNPYYSTSDKTYGVSTYYYDALNRKIKQLDSDGVNFQTWGYNGATVKFTDENQNQWQRTTDGLGRLIIVLEPNGASQSASMVTTYGFDGLNNLLSVTQLGGSASTGITRFRSFTYDALSRLLCSSNPENSTSACPSAATGTYVTGTTGYTYDPDSNVLTKEDARGVTTSYSYDALNRMLSKTFSGDPTNTLFSCNQYDSTSVTNGIGRLSNAWTQSAACPVPSVAPAAPGTGFWTMRSILAYDPMGRLKSENQYTPSNRNSSTPYALSYSYDLAGNLTGSNNGNSASQMVFTNTFDWTGRLQTLINSSNPSLPVSLFSLPTTSTFPCSNSSTYPYAAFGGLMNANFGAGLTLNRAYDNRLRTTCEIDTGSGVGIATSGSATATITGAEQSN
jgi:YD repeat-containing protein